MQLFFLTTSLYPEPPTRPGGVYPETLLIKEGVTQGYPFCMVLYGLILSVLMDKIQGGVSQMRPVMVR